MATQGSTRDLILAAALSCVTPTLERMLTYSMFSTFFEMVRQDLPREETEQYISQLLKFYTGGWEKLWSR